MEPKEFDFEFPRGNSFEFIFDLLDENDIKILDLDEIYFTVKNSFNDTQYLFQKRLTRKNGISFKDGEITVRLSPEDTSSLEFKKYVYDVAIEIKKEDYFKTALLGNFILSKNATNSSK